MPKGLWKAISAMDRVHSWDPHWCNQSLFHIRSQTYFRFPFTAENRLLDDTFNSDSSKAPQIHKLRPYKTYSNCWSHCIQTHPFEVSSFVFDWMDLVTCVSLDRDQSYVFIVSSTEAEKRGDNFIPSVLYSFKCYVPKERKRKTSLTKLKNKSRVRGKKISVNVS